MTAFLVGIGCFVAHLALSLAWLRLPGPFSPITRHTASALGTHVLGIAAAALWVGPFAYWPAATVAGFGAVCWLFAFSAVYKSVSLRVLTRLDRTPGHALPFEAIARDHVWPEFAARGTVLVALGCAEQTEGGLFAVTEKGKRIARRIEAVQRACGIEASGMYEGSSMVHSH
jgi:hypothetical protein